MKWISVSDRLPDEPGRYAILYKRNGRIRQCFVADYDPLDGWSDFMENMEILHWFPLPEPPTEGE